MRYFCLFSCAVVGISVLVVSQCRAEEPQTDETHLFDRPQASANGIDRVKQRQQVTTAATRSDVQQALAHARQIATEDPVGAESHLKLVLFSVQEMSDINLEVKRQLVGRLRSAIRYTASIKIEKDERDRVRHEALAQQLARRRVVEGQARTEQKVAALMERLTSLLDEGRYREAEEQIAREALAVAPGDAAVTAASTTAYHAGVYEEITAIVQQRNKARGQSYVQVESAAIPFQVDPPIVFPAADIWEGLTQRRRRAYVDLQSRSKNEREILEQLDEPTRMDFEETPLSEAVAYLSEYHNILITLDRRALEDVGIGSDTPVSLRLKGVSLRSGLRLMLKSIDPATTYMIKDEVLQLTTREEVGNHLTARNYPVADLVLPVENLRIVGSGGFSAGAVSNGFGGGAFGAGQMQQQGGFNQNPFQGIIEGGPFDGGPFDGGRNDNNFNF